MAHLRNTSYHQDSHDSYASSSSSSHRQPHTYHHRSLHLYVPPREHRGRPAYTTVRPFIINSNDDHHRPVRRDGYEHNEHHGRVGNYVADRLVPTMLRSSDRPLEVFMNFGDAKLCLPDDGHAYTSSSCLDHLEHATGTATTATMSIETTTVGTGTGTGIVTMTMAMTIAMIGNWTSNSTEDITTVILGLVPSPTSVSSPAQVHAICHHLLFLFLYPGAARTDTITMAGNMNWNLSSTKGIGLINLGLAPAPGPISVLSHTHTPETRLSPSLPFLYQHSFPSLPQSKTPHALVGPGWR
ncbi:hypothetical protein QBC32DRAFT_380898 [Pseudoneurospora amorphoporcata]|uniref:Uncharacterized protein n=1 Tax=Pseudoneurospora amorphoporcata TaxID=241081 RepID=A0AAN6SCG4_9PEZI|nr:hypothetical protein QBC32DRAFT_380898 [Pseudoneurospora amorphoporcata]